MELNRQRISRMQQLYLLCGVAVFCSALAYYFFWRFHLPWPGDLLETNNERLLAIHDLSRGSYPSFAFALSFGMMAIAIFRLHRVKASAAIFTIWSIGLLHEVTLGAYSSLDVFAGSCGALIALGLALHTGHGVISFDLSKHRYNRTEKWKFSALVIASATMATATSAYDPVNRSDCLEYDENDICVSQVTYARPVYITYTELRNAVRMSGPRELESVSRIYLYNSMLFINERNKGIHIIDNRFPATPERIGFIEIPGNTEISIRDDNLYADSYVDLVTLDLSNIENITEIARQESIFPYNSRQNIPGNIRLSGTIDSSIGVIVGYQ